jgi:hypothetical protein
MGCGRSRVVGLGLLGILLGVLQAGVGARGAVITEFLAQNRDGLQDEDGERSDWIEVYNETSAPASLDGWYLSDHPAHPGRWRFPATNLPPHGFLIVYASGKDRRLPGRPLHTNFKLRQKGGYLGLFRPEGTTASDFSPGYPPQRPGISYGLPASFFGQGVAGPRPVAEALPFPTPGAPNVVRAGTEPVAAPTASLHSGFQPGPASLTLSCATEGARLLFTTNGASPEPDSGQPYTGPIRIDRSTVVRAVAIRATGGRASDELVRTILIRPDVLHQTGAGWPATWGIREKNPVPADYEMDPEIVNHPAYSNRVDRALDALPSVLLTVPLPDLFDPQHGIYANPMQNGVEWERAAVAEWLEPGGTTGFQVHCGIRIQGGWNRRPEECPKHSMRLVFKSRHGEGALRYPVFGDTGAAEFSELVLRGGCNNTWLHWSGEERRRGDYLRDEWMRETYAAMGHLSARGLFVHVYLNGLYWGIYNLVERPAGPFLAAHLGGRPADYDVRNSDRVLEGDSKAWDAMMAVANRGVDSDEAMADMESRLDVPGFIDYMLLNHYGANADYDRASNWYAARPRKREGRFQFLVWDGERTLEQATNSTLAADDDQSPLRLFQKLRGNAAFRHRFGARAREVLGGNGPLSAREAASRYERLAGRLEPAIVLESARWGDYRRDVHPYKEGPYELYTVDDHWRPEVRRLLNEFFPERPRIFLQQLKEAGLTD